MTDDEVDLLRLDYATANAFIDKADGWLFQIRNWAVVTTSGLIAYSVTEHTPGILYFAPVLVCGFWLFEAIYKSFHEACVRQSHQLEELLQRTLDKASQLPAAYVFGIGHAITPVGPKQLWRQVTRRDRWHNNVTYVALLLTILGAWSYLQFAAAAGARP